MQCDTIKKIVDISAASLIALTVAAREFAWMHQEKKTPLTSKCDGAVICTRE
jgi:hypothetical protein